MILSENDLMSLYYQLVNTHILNMCQELRASLVPLVVKDLLANAGDERDVILIPGREDPLEEGMASHSSVPAWRIPRTEEPGGLQSRGSQRVRHDWVTWHIYRNWEQKGKQKGQKFLMLCENYISKTIMSEISSWRWKHRALKTCIRET